MAKKKICLALQGGGAHGAFTWGVVDRLLQEEALDIEAVSGTSAGAMNGAILVDGLKRGGRQHARERLERFWHSIAQAGDSVFKPGRMAPALFGANADWSPLALWSDMLSLVWSPYDNPYYTNVLVDVIDKELTDFSELNNAKTPYLFVCATNVNTNARRIFGPGEHSTDALTASACLPSLFRAVEVNGAYYWDGGYLGNPALYPLRSPSLSADLLIVWINPLRQPALPTNARAILDRLNEITFNATLVQEIEAIEAINELKAPNGGARAARDGRPAPYKHIRLHEIKDEPLLAQLGHVSKSNTDWSFLLELREWGRDAGERWLAANFDSLGKRQTADVRGILRCLGSR